MEILAWFLLGMLITNLFFFVYWWRGHDIEYTDIFVYIACILSGPFSLLLPIMALICLIMIKIHMKIEKIKEEPFLKGRNKKGRTYYE